MHPYRIVRVFTTAESAEEQLVSLVLELPLAPAGGQNVILPGDPEPRRVARVVQVARLAAPTWQPGFQSVELVRVELETEDPAGLPPALPLARRHRARPGGSEPMGMHHRAGPIAVTEGLLR